MVLNEIEFTARGESALFSDPVTRVGGQKCSYPIPTYSALIGLVKSIYWKPPILWYIDAIRVMKPIRTFSRGVKPVHYQNDNNDLAYYMYLADVEYQIRAHFEWNPNRPEWVCDHDAMKHSNIARKALQAGGRLSPYFGVSECPALVKPCVFGSGAGYYDGSGERDFDVMLHSVTYADEAYSAETRGAMSVTLWRPVMRDGVIEFIRPEDCTMRKIIRPMKVKSFPCYLRKGAAR